MARRTTMQDYQCQVCADSDTVTVRDQILPCLNCEHVEEEKFKEADPWFDVGGEG
jgi:hypothetical protein